MSKANLVPPAPNFNPPSRKNDPKPRSYEDLLRVLNFPPKEQLAGPGLFAREIVMLSAYRGTGKTWATLQLGFSVASGAPFLGWEVPKARGVLYIDGEMADEDMRERALIIEAGLTPEQRTLAKQNFAYFSHAQFNGNFPNLASERGQQLIERHAPEDGLIILDNKSTLVRTDHGENDAASWDEMQDWLSRLRTMGHTVWIVHRTGKPDKDTGKVSQRGTSKNEDIINKSVLLTRTPKMPREQFTWEFDKFRTKAIAQGDMKFTVRITDRGLTRCNPNAERKARVRELRGQGLTCEQISAHPEVAPISTATIAKYLNEAACAKPAEAMKAVA